MTEPVGIRRKKASACAIRQGVIRGGCLCLLLLFLIFSEQTADRVFSGLILCARRVIPSLFPFLIVSALLVSSDLLSPLCRRSAPLFRTLFGIGGEGGCALLLGLVCGFPVATQCACAFYRDGRMSRRELTRFMTFANNPSPAFLVGFVGGSLLDDPGFGWLLFGCTVSASLLWGLLLRAIRGPVCRESAGLVRLAPTKKSGPMLTEAIVNATRSMLSICGFVVFFSALLGGVEALLPENTAPLFSALLGGCLELTGGMARAAACPAPLCYLLCGLFAGWSGISVHLQLMSLCADTGVSFRPYLLAKLMCGALTALLLGPVLWLLGYV